MNDRDAKMTLHFLWVFWQRKKYNFEILRKQIGKKSKHLDFVAVKHVQNSSA